jgi:membrane protein
MLILLAAKQVGALLGKTFAEWTQDHASQYGAAMAYYAFFSLAPLLILAIALAGAFFGIEAAEGKIVTELQHFIGRDGAEAVQALVRRARGSDAALSISIAGIGAL